jgi:hypothetical protein
MHNSDRTLGTFYQSCQSPQGERYRYWRRIFQPSESIVVQSALKLSVAFLRGSEAPNYIPTTSELIDAGARDALVWICTCKGWSTPSWYLELATDTDHLLGTLYTVFGTKIAGLCSAIGDDHLEQGQIYVIRLVGHKRAKFWISVRVIMTQIW